MKHEWQFGQQVTVPMVVGRTNIDTLIEYDGPYLVLLQKAVAQFLALRIDEDESGVRWLQSPISTVEYEALFSGELPLRNVFLKQDVLLVEDSHDEEPVKVWELNPSTIPDRVLPKRGAPLPAYVRSSYRSKLGDDVPAEFRVGAKGAPDDRITFTRLSQVTSQIQHLWDSIASTMGAQSLTLNATGLVRGSFKITVEVEDRALLKRVAHAYRDLTRATYDENRLTEILSKVPQVVTENFSHYLRALDLNQLDVLTQWHEDATEIGDRTAFVGYANAGRTRHSIKPAKIGETKRAVLTVNGFFQGFQRDSGTFEFYDDLGRLYKGKVRKELRDAPLHDGINVYHARKYRTEIESILKDAKEKFTLLAYSVLD